MNHLNFYWMLVVPVCALIAWGVMNLMAFIWGGLVAMRVVKLVRVV